MPEREEESAARRRIDRMMRNIGVYSRSAEKARYLVKIEVKIDLEVTLHATACEFIRDEVMQIT